MTTSYPLISCICVTDRRPEFLERAINCFLQQNYDYKELVISYPQGDLQSRAIVEHYTPVDTLQILSLEREAEESVGNARNIAIASCNGEYICVWDDDDWYHPNRLIHQYQSMKMATGNFNASVLTRLLLYDEAKTKTYLSFSYSWENTLLCKKEIVMQNQYAHSNKGEDTHIIKFLDAKGFLYHIHDAPYLYVYIYHGSNTWNYDHYMYLVNKSEPLDHDVSLAIKSVL